MAGAVRLAGEDRARRESLAYTAGNALWAMDLPDGKARRVASGAGISTPRISPSGNWIAYRQGGAAWVVSRAGGQPKRIGEGATQWHSQRDEVLLETGRGVAIFSPANSWGSATRTIPEASLPVAISPDGGELVYGKRTPAGQGLLYRADIAAAHPAKVVQARNGDGLIPYAWTGDTLLFWLDGSFSSSLMADGLDLFRAPASGGTPQSLDKGLLHQDFLSLSPDGIRLAMTAGEGRESWRRKRIVTIDLSTRAEEYLSAEDAVAICPSWSPDGSRIVYTALPEGLEAGSGPERLFLGQRRIWLADSSGKSPPVRLTRDERYRDEEPLFLADGRHILFGRIERAGQNAVKSLWLMDDRGGGLTQIAGPLQANDTFEGESWFGYYGTIDWRAEMDYRGSAS